MNQLPIPIGEMDDMVQQEGMVTIPARWYRMLTDDGIVETVYQAIFKVLERCRPPEEAIRFARWQMPKLDREASEYLLIYLEEMMTIQMPEHPYKIQWNEYADELREYTRTLREKWHESKHVIWVRPGEEDYTVYAFCRDYQLRKLDMKPLIEEGGAFTRLRDPEVFRSTLSVINSTVAWDVGGNGNSYACIDLSPGFVYEEGEIIEGRRELWTLKWGECNI